jgi:hypothetical protein
MNKTLVAIAVILAATLVVAVTLAATPEAFANGGSNSYRIQKNFQSHSQSGSGQHYESHCVNGVCTETGQ